MDGCDEVVGLMGESGSVVGLHVCVITSRTGKTAKKTRNKAKNRNNINRGRRNAAKSSHTAFIAFDRLFLVCSFTQVRRV
ncbi:hypothetical protein ACLB2K_048781 [Fragaria x ananassa]